MNVTREMREGYLESFGVYGSNEEVFEWYFSLDNNPNTNEFRPSLSKQEGGTHYMESEIQPIEYILANKLGFVEGNVIKYVTRYKSKNGVEDLKKAIHYLEMLIEEESK